MSLLCCVAAGSTFALVVGKAAFHQQIERLEREIEHQEAVDAERENAFMLLRELAMHVRTIRLETGEFPREIGEGAPDDPWGNEIEYRRIHSARARVWSRGPDGIRGTEDDVELEID